MLRDNRRPTLFFATSAGDAEASAYQARSRACKTARVAHFSPHDLPHRG